jgi:hypothetical protein
MDALYTYNLGAAIGKDYVPVAEDVVRMVCIQFTIQLLLWINDPDPATSLFSVEFFVLVLYVVLGVLLYWLFFKKLVRIE